MMKQIIHFFLVFLPAILFAKVWDSPIALDGKIDAPQSLRDSMELKVSPFKFNQAGYLPGAGAEFIYQGEASAVEIVELSSGEVLATVPLDSVSAPVEITLQAQKVSQAWITSGGSVQEEFSDTRSGPLKVGILPEGLPQNSDLVFRVGDSTSTAFQVREDLYSEVRNGLLHFFGMQRSGDADSWFHGPMHVNDATPGGWNDCGDYLKEGTTISFAGAMLGLMAVALPEKDEDKYRFNHNYTDGDGIPDVLREAKVGAEYFLTAYQKANQEIEGMVTSIGNFGKEHSFWAPGELMQGVVTDREPRVEVGANVLARAAANMAFVAKGFAERDPAYSQALIEAAKAFYEYAKLNEDASSSPAYNGESQTSDDLALAALALWSATADTLYGYELYRDPAIGEFAQVEIYRTGTFAGGFLAKDNLVFTHNFANFSWSYLHTSVLWGFYRLILSSTEKAAFYGIAEEERLALVEDVLYALDLNLGALSVSTPLVTLPSHGIPWVTSHVAGDPVWNQMDFIQQEWVPNRFMAGNAVELFFYYDVAKEVEGIEFPDGGAQDWKTQEVKKILTSQLDFFFGKNNFGISYVMGLGDRNIHHAHHRESNPELRSGPALLYPYRVPVGAVLGGYPLDAESAAYNVDDYYHSEVCLGMNTSLLLPVMGLAKEVAPKAMNVELVQLGVKELRTTSASVQWALPTFARVVVEISDGETVLTGDTLQGVRGVASFTELQAETEYSVKVSIQEPGVETIEMTKWNGKPLAFKTLKEEPVSELDFVAPSQSPKVSVYTSTSLWGGSSMLEVVLLNHGLDTLTQVELDLYFKELAGDDLDLFGLRKDLAIGMGTDQFVQMLNYNKPGVVKKSTERGGYSAFTITLDQDTLYPLGHFQFQFQLSHLTESGDVLGDAVLRDFSEDWFGLEGVPEVAKNSLVNELESHAKNDLVPVRVAGNWVYGRAPEPLENDVRPTSVELNNLNLSGPEENGWLGAVDSLPLSLQALFSEGADLHSWYLGGVKQSNDLWVQASNGEAVLAHKLSLAGVKSNLVVEVLSKSVDGNVATGYARYEYQLKTFEFVEELTLREELPHYALPKLEGSRLYLPEGGRWNLQFVDASGKRLASQSWNLNSASWVDLNLPQGKGYLVFEKAGKSWSMRF